MTISINSYSNVATIYPSKASAAGAAFGNALSEATSTVAVSSGDRAEISSAPVALSDKSSANSAVVDEASWDRLMHMPEGERKSAIAKQADAISKSQGLPSGKYDYEHMSVGQLSVVRANMVQNLGYKADQLSATWNMGLQKADGGTSLGSEIDWTAPRDMFGELTRGRERLASTNDFASAKVYGTAILAMKNTSFLNTANEWLFKMASN
jgi:hypothetical protein